MKPEHYQMLAEAKMTVEQIGVVMRIMAEAEDAMKVAEEARKSVARERVQRWREKQKDAVTLPKHNGNATVRLTRVEDSSSKKDNNKEEKKDRAPAAPTPCQELESVLDHEHAQAVVDHRQRLKRPLTAYAAKQLASKLSKAPDANVAADAMIANGWQGFEAGWLENRTTRPHSTASPPPGKRMNAVEANLARRIRKNEPEGGRRDNGDAELLPPDRPGLPDFVRDAGKSLTWDG
jgi:hypothetical protein